MDFRGAAREHYVELANSGFFTIFRDNPDVDTRKETLDILAKHFGFCDNTAYKKRRHFILRGLRGKSENIWESNTSLARRNSD